MGASSSSSPSLPPSSEEQGWVNERWTLSQRPDGHFEPSRDAKKVSETIDRASLKTDDVVIRMEMLSVDAFVRTMLDAEAYHGAIKVGDTIPAFGYGTVVWAGSEARGQLGKRVLGLLGAQSYSVQPAKDTHAVLTFYNSVPVTACLGLLSVTTGLAAYVGVFKVARPPQRGDTVVVSAAAGAVGSFASQLAKSTGARVIGVAGGERKQKFCLDSLGLDAAIDYKAEDVALKLDELAPDGVDFFFDNVGGEILDCVLDRLNRNARVVVCGGASHYSGQLNQGRDAKGRGGGVRGPSNYLKLAETSSTMVGFNVMHYLTSLPDAIANMCWMYSRGSIKIHEQVELGLDAFPMALHKMFNQGHCGKLLVDITQKIPVEIN